NVAFGALNATNATLGRLGSAGLAGLLRRRLLLRRVIGLVQRHRATDQRETDQAEADAEERLHVAGPGLMETTGPSPSGRGEAEP
ncbi:hypothetical protein, partial [Amycolatopsis tolypomycina]|uniref:hypothetical protein n=1 Tax=Amycolatopsis tolypomycina TaxID=208445 RepID=UPI0033B7B7F2